MSERNWSEDFTRVVDHVMQNRLGDAKQVVLAMCLASSASAREDSVKFGPQRRALIWLARKLHYDGATDTYRLELSHPEVALLGDGMVSQVLLDALAIAKDANATPFDDDGEAPSFPS